MKTYTTLRNLYGTLTLDNSTTNKTLGDQLINDAIREIMTQPYDWDFLEKTDTDTTVASQQAYNLPGDYDKMDAVSITVGTTRWYPKEITDRAYWNKLTQTTITSNIPEFYFIFGRQIKFYPTPSSSSNTITYEYKKMVGDLNIADYTTGTVTATNGSTTLTGSGTTWTAPMVGRYIRLTGTDTAASTGDHRWYEISAVGSATAITLKSEYQGTSTAGAAYTLGQVPALPEAYDNLPVYRAAEVYWTSKDEKRAAYYNKLYTEGLARLIADHGSKSNDVGIELRYSGLRNPNHTLTL